MDLRYTITVLPSDLELWLHVKTPGSYKPRFNAAPLQLLPIISLNNYHEVIMARWGFHTKPEKENEVKTYTKSLSTITSNKTWTKLLQSNRCLVLADGFYCWKQISKHKRIPYRVVSKDRKLLCFAGICMETGDPSGDMNALSFMVITRPSYKPVHEITETMPVIIESGKEMNWLNLKGMSFDASMNLMEIEDWALLRYYPVSPSIDNVKVDGPDLIKPVPPADQLGNLTLFE